MTHTELACRGVVGLVFAVAASSKIRGAGAYREFASWLAALPVPLARSRALPVLLTAAEVAIVPMVAVPDTAPAGLVLAAGCLTVMTAGAVIIIIKGARVPCQCFGQARSPLGTRHLVRDGILLAVATTGAVIGWRGHGAGAGSPAAIALTLAAALTVATFLVFLDDLTALFGEEASLR
jgi:hypothetical protein